MKKEYWLTPPDIYNELDEEFNFDFDPCPYPRPKDYNSLAIDWKSINYVNPPFCKADDTVFGGTTAFVRKAIEEHNKGKTSVLILPTRNYVNLLLEANAEMRSAGRIKWLDTKTREPMKGPPSVTCFILRGKGEHEGS